MEAGAAEREHTAEVRRRWQRRKTEEHRANAEIAKKYIAEMENRKHNPGPSRGDITAQGIRYLYRVAASLATTADNLG